ncbi:MAG: ferrous iron transport protein A [Desulfonatronovibrionaceae bacterium]
MTLGDQKPGKVCRVKSIKAEGGLWQRLMDLGLYPGLEIRMVRNAPLNDPLEVEVDGVFVSLRRKEAGFVEVDE